jgi:hypothetical protein
MAGPPQQSATAMFVPGSPGTDCSNRAAQIVQPRDAAVGQAHHN